MDSSDDDQPIRRKRSKRRNCFLDDEAEDTVGEDSDSEDSDEGDLSDFIDDTIDNNGDDDYESRKKLEIQKNKIKLSNYIASLSDTEQTLIGLSFAYTNIDDIFE